MNGEIVCEYQIGSEDWEARFVSNLRKENPLEGKPSSVRRWFDSTNCSKSSATGFAQLIADRSAPGGCGACGLKLSSSRNQQHHIAHRLTGRRKRFNPRPFPR